MAASLHASVRRGDSTKRSLHFIGACGTVFALVILGASMFLRLTTIFGLDGQPISTLPATWENAARLAHRLAASGVGLLAIWAVMLCWIRRPLPPHFVRPIISMATTTVILAVIGPLTPGYRYAAVTIANVGGGMVLLIAFWWLRETVAGKLTASRSVDPLLRMTLFVFLAHVATGAAASAYEMQGVRWPTFMHLSSALLATMLISATLWDRRHESPMPAPMIATAGLFATQLALGFTLLWLGERPVWAALMHGMLSPLLAMALVSLAIRARPGGVRQ